MSYVPHPDHLVVQVLCSELTDNVIANLKGIMDEVVCPLIQVPRNRKGWPSMSTKEVMLHLNKYKSNLHVAAGQYSVSLSSFFSFSLPSIIE